MNAEQAETVRRIYEMYLSGQTLRSIKEALESGGFKNSAGTMEWTTSNLRTILSDEKYCGDVLLQKTFIQDCISKKVIKNTGQLPMYLIQNHHEAIIPRDRFDAVQVELARRKTLTNSTKKSAPTGMSRYSGKYALSGLLFCGECGTAYRRVVWTQHGEKRAVWRCSSRLDYGKKYCKESPTLDESPLQQAVLAAINASMSGCKVLADQLVDAMEQELAPIPGESMSLGDIDRAVTELGKQFDTLLAEAANGDADEYAERFRTISTTMEELKRRKAAILGIRQEQEQISRRIHAAASAMTAATVGITEWDDGVVYQMLEKVTVLTFTLAFVCGNHENYDALERYAVAEWHGGKVHRIRPHVLHLMRGQIFELEGCRFFTMGGAKSHDIEDGILEPDAPDFERRLMMLQRKPRARYRINHISWWAQELPSDEEYAEARRSLDAVGWQVDYIITHCAPTSIALMGTRHNEADRLTDFLQEVQERAKYHYWLFGHYHDNKAIDEKHILLWEQIVRII